MSQTCPSTNKRWHLLFELGQTGSGPSFQSPQKCLGFFRQKKRFLFVLTLATVPGCIKPEQEQGKENIVCLNGAWVLWCPFSLDSKEAGYKLAAATPFGASARGTSLPGDKR